MITLTYKNMDPYIEKNTNTNFKMLIHAYVCFTDCNCFDDLVCPCCKQKGCLSLYKTYDRNITYYEDGQVVDDIIPITVLICKNCKNYPNKQKYHALLPDFILPYHIKAANMILSALHLRLIKKMKIEEILAKFNITHKLFYDWLYKFIIYLLPASIVLEQNKDPITIISQLNKKLKDFLAKFYQLYWHPFFLFRKTCVPLCITP